MNESSTGTPWPIDEAEQSALIERLARAQLIERDGRWPGANEVGKARADLLAAMTAGRIAQPVNREAARAFLAKYNVPTLAPKPQERG